MTYFKTAQKFDKMKKTLFLLLSFAFLFTACEDKDVTSTKGLIGTWIGTTQVDEDETDMVCQFFAVEDSNTSGKYVEAISYYNEVEEYGITYAIPYTVYVGGKFNVSNSYLKITYDTATVQVLADTTAIRDYVMRVLEYDREQGEQRYIDNDVEELIQNYTLGTNVDLSELWAAVYNDSNNGKGDGFSDLQVNEKKMSYVSADMGKIEFKHSLKDMFDTYPIDDL